MNADHLRTLCFVCEDLHTPMEWAQLFDLDDLSERQWQLRVGTSSLGTTMTLAMFLTCYRAYDQGWRRHP